jgi:hypothetical protein
LRKEVGFKMELKAFQYCKVNVEVDYTEMLETEWKILFLMPDGTSKDITNKTVLEFINELGYAGWELVSRDGTGDHPESGRHYTQVCYVFKREIDKSDFLSWSRYLYV